MLYSEQKDPITIMLLFISAIIFLAGFSIITSTVAPILLTKALVQNKDYHPQLPIAQARDTAFEDISKLPPTQPYPPLSELTNTEPGDWIRIPSQDINVPLVSSPSLDDKDVLETLNSGAALYPNGVAPGYLGNVFISAHSTGEPWKGKYRFAFLAINELENNNLIHIDYSGARYTYKIVNKQIIEPSPEIQVISDRPVPTVTLMACWPLWSTKNRVLITGELNHITKLTPKPS